MEDNRNAMRGGPFGTSASGVYSTAANYMTSQSSNNLSSTSMFPTKQRSPSIDSDGSESSLFPCENNEAPNEAEDNNEDPELAQGVLMMSGLGGFDDAFKAMMPNEGESKEETGGSAEYVHPLLQLVLNNQKEDGLPPEILRDGPLVEQLSSVCSTLTGSSGVILKFSEFDNLLDYHPPQPKRRRVNSRPTPHSTPTTNPLLRSKELDEEEMLRSGGRVPNLEAPCEKPSIPHPLFVSLLEEANEHPTIPSLEPKDASNMEQPQEHYESDELNLSDPTLLQLRTWEEDIVWDEKCLSSEKHDTIAQNDSHLHSSAHSQASNFSFFPHLPAARLDGQSKALWGEMPARQDMVQSDTKQVESLFLPNLEHSILPITNSDIDTGRWLNDVVLDTPLHHAHPLILDLNDNEMVFSEEETSNTTPVNAPRKVKDVDPLNLSNDAYYLESISHTNHITISTGPITDLQHAIPALNLSVWPTHYSPDTLQNFHRPKLDAVPVNRPIPLVSAAQYTSTNVMSHHHHHHHSNEAPRKLRHLSGQDGKLVFIEYIEENPLLMMGVGMSSRIRNYYRYKDGDAVTTVIDSRLGSYQEGEPAVLHQSDRSPFLGNIEPGSCVQSLENKLFIAPLMKHNQKYTDFLLVRPVTRDKLAVGASSSCGTFRDDRWVIREMGSLFACGQEHPKVEVPSPFSPAMKIFRRDRVRSYIYSLFRCKDNIRSSEIQVAFPALTENSIRKHLKDCADFQRGGGDDSAGCWVLKQGFVLPKQEEVTPEGMCAFESMAFGIERLDECGIEKLVNANSLGSQIIPLLLDEELKKNAERLQDEVELTPWNLTANFINHQYDLQLTGLGDPSERAEMFSYLVDSSKRSEPTLQKSTKPKLQGTDSDLRKIPLETARAILVKCGESAEEVANLHRWDLISRVRVKANNNKELARFARNISHPTLARASEHYERLCNFIFNKQLQLLSRSEDENNTTEDGDFENLFSGPASKQPEEDDWFADSETTTTTTSTSTTTTTSTTTSAPAPASVSPPPQPATTLPPHVLKTLFKSYVPITTALKAAGLVPETKKKAASSGPKKPPTLTSDVVEQQQELRKAKRRLQEKRRRLTQAESMQQCFIKKMEKKVNNQEPVEDELPPVENADEETTLLGGSRSHKTKNNLTCKACGEVGHIRTNKGCPLYGPRQTPTPRPDVRDRRSPGPPSPAANSPSSPVTPISHVATQYSPVLPTELDLVEAASPAPPTLPTPSSTTSVDTTRQIKVERPIARPPSTPISQPNKDKLKFTLVIPSNHTPTSPVSPGDDTCEPQFMNELDASPRSPAPRSPAPRSPVITAPPPVVAPIATPLVSKRKREQDFEEILSHAVTRLSKFLWAVSFNDPVPDAVTDYKQIISEPMDLQTISKKIKTKAYTNRSQLIQDLRQMSDNAFTYNSRGVGLYGNAMLKPFADLLYEHGAAFLWDQDVVLTPLERELDKSTGHTNVSQPECLETSKTVNTATTTSTSHNTVHISPPPHSSNVIIKAPSRLPVVVPLTSTTSKSAHSPFAAFAPAASLRCPVKRPVVVAVPPKSQPPAPTTHTMTVKVGKPAPPPPLALSPTIYTSPELADDIVTTSPLTPTSPTLTLSPTQLLASQPTTNH
ncbi:transcription initiation factor TFIID subunit 1 [Pelomyxa schiedti]|nr:transcription initiation factor TFIID subunit 1 [Pelomyxa schiedti]